MLIFLSLLLFGTLLGGFLVMAVLAVREIEDEIGDAETAEPAGSTILTYRRPSDGIIRDLERRLRSELAIAQAYADDPSAETLWPTETEEDEA